MPSFDNNEKGPTENPEEQHNVSRSNSDCTENSVNDVETGTLGRLVSSVLDGTVPPSGKDEADHESDLQVTTHQQLPPDENDNDDDDDDDEDDTFLDPDIGVREMSSEENRPRSEDKLSESRWDYEKKILVLVNLELLNSIRNDTTVSSSSPKPAKAIPVNRFGFPSGYGRGKDERSGPYLYVACAYKNSRRLSFELMDMSGSFRSNSTKTNNHNGYVTVERCDTGEWATIRSDWETHVLEDSVAIRSALLAAKLRRRNNNTKQDGSEASFDKDQRVEFEKALGVAASHHHPPPHGMEEETNNTSSNNPKTNAFWWIIIHLVAAVHIRVSPWLNRAVATAKHFATQLIQGKRPFSLKVRITGINIVVTCSIMFLFLQVFTLGWIPPEYDDTLVWLGL